MFIISSWNVGISRQEKKKYLSHIINVLKHKSNSWLEVTYCLRDVKIEVMRLACQRQAQGGVAKSVTMSSNFEGIPPLP